MRLKHRRLFLIGGTLGGLGIATFLILTVLRESLIFFYTPSDLLHKEIMATQCIRVGGVVVPHSVVWEGEKVSFSLMDTQKTLRVIYYGLLPDLFREGQGIVAEGYLQEPTLFVAKTVLAKHDETYMPKGVPLSSPDSIVHK